jgi:hypothetical protein
MKARKTIDHLTDQVEELLGVLERHPCSADVEERSARVQDALDSARHAIRPSFPVRIGRYANSVDNYVTGYPRLGFLTGIMIGGAVAYLAARVRAD